MQIAVASGKGSTGKTAFVAAFAKPAERPVVLADCDVDAANLALALQGRDTQNPPLPPEKNAHRSRITRRG